MKLLEIDKSGACKDDSRDANHCPGCGGHKMDWYVTGPCTDCEAVLDENFRRRKLNQQYPMIVSLSEIGGEMLVSVHPDGQVASVFIGNTDHSKFDVDIEQSNAKLGQLMEYFPSADLDFQGESKQFFEQRNQG